MPRQDITYHNSEMTAPDPNGTEPIWHEEHHGLDLHWSRPGMYGDGTPGHVQVGLTISQPKLRRLATPDPNEPDPTARTLYTDDLTREQINLLIRTLRRARDAAYGADE